MSTPTMQKYFATALRDQDFPLSAPVYLASEVDAEIAKHKAMTNDMATEIEAKDARIAVLENALRDCIAATGEYTVSECNEVRRIAKAALEGSTL